jgi:hypothetical protein
LEEEEKDMSKRMHSAKNPKVRKNPLFRKLGATLLRSLAKEQQNEQK